MTGAELAAQIADAIAQDSRLDAIREKIEAGTADLKDSEQYTAICAEITGRMMRGAVEGLDDREGSFTEIARERYRETFDIYSAVQAIVDRALGIRIAAKEPGFQEDRARKIGHALEDQTVPESTILRRAESASENFVMSQHDRCVEENAKFRDRAGLQSYAVRTGGAKCCQWCADVSGKYPANETPDGFWGRHDNCKCSILYESKRSGRQLLRGTSKKWERVAPGAGAGELHRLSGDEAAAAGAPEPVVFTKEQAKNLQANHSLTVLTKSKSNGIMITEGAEHKRNPELEKTIRKCIQQERPVFAESLAKFYSRIPPEDGKTIVATHGTPMSVEIYGHTISAKIFANILRSRKDFDPSNEIILIACHTGNTDNTDNCFAQQLANELGMIVHAPTEFGAINSRGQYYSSDNTGLKRVGDFIMFEPRRDEE